MAHGLFVPCHLQKFIRPGKHMLISFLSPDIARMLLPVRKPVRSLLAVFAEPEPDRVRRRLPGLILRKPFRRVARISEHQDRLQPRERLRPEDRRRRSRRIRRSVGIALFVFDAVAHLPRRSDPVLRRVEIMPRPVRIVFKIIELAVLFRFDRYRLFRCLPVRKSLSEGQQKE